MRLCRFQTGDRAEVGFFHDTRVIPLSAAARAFADSTGETLELPIGDDLLRFLPPADGAASAKKLAAWIEEAGDDSTAALALPAEDVQWLLPIPRPHKLFMLAGNYAAHVEEGGEIAVERAETFPYLFMKPPTTALQPHGSSVRLPPVSPLSIDYELELAVVIGRLAKQVTEADALDYVAGYTVINDISDRRFLPNPNRREREKDKFFDWLHGKWHDGSCPCGPCVTSRDAIPDPQNLSMRLRVNGEVRQDATTALQVFPVAAVIEFISSFVTLEPGDIISTGTPAGVGASQGIFLQAGDRIEATIQSIGTLVTSVVT